MTLRLKWTFAAISGQLETSQVRDHKLIISPHIQMSLKCRKCRQVLVTQQEALLTAHGDCVSANESSVNCASLQFGAVVYLQEDYLPSWVGAAVDEVRISIPPGTTFVRFSLLELCNKPIFRGERTLVIEPEDSTTAGYDHNIAP